MLLQQLEKRKLIHPPKFLVDNTHYLCVMGSNAYGTNIDSSDLDIYGWVIPPKRIVFPHTANVIQGFGYQGEKFDQWQQHHVEDKEEKKSYDFAIFNIVKYFQLLMDNNPNVLDSLFIPYDCILHMSQIGNMVRENRKLFLHKGCFKKYKGYALSQMHKMRSKEPEPGSKRAKIREEFGMDLKYAVHLVRLLTYVEQILLTEDLDMRKDSEQLKAIRRGEWTEEQVFKWSTEKEIALEKLYLESKLRTEPAEKEIKQLLLNCLEQHYGTLENCIVNVEEHTVALQQIKNILDKIKL